MAKKKVASVEVEQPLPDELTVEFLRDHASRWTDNVLYKAGEVVTFPANQAQKLLDHGLAKAVEDARD